MAPTASTDAHRRRQRDALLVKSRDEATAAVERITTLRGEAARKVAATALIAGGDSLRGEYAIRIGATPHGASLAAAVAALGVDLAIFAAVAAGKQPRALRPAATVAIACRLGLFAFFHWHNQRTREHLARTLTAGEAGA